MKTISSLFVLFALLLFTVTRGHTSTPIEPQLHPLPDQKSAILQVAQDAKDDISVKIKNAKEKILIEIAIDDDAEQYKTVDFSSLPDGTYFMDIYHDGVITRKELEVRWNGIEVVKVKIMKRDPFHQYFFNYIL